MSIPTTEDRVVGAFHAMAADETDIRHMVPVTDGRGGEAVHAARLRMMASVIFCTIIIVSISVGVPAGLYVFGTPPPQPVLPTSPPTSPPNSTCVSSVYDLLVIDGGLTKQMFEFSLVWPARATKSGSLCSFPGPDGIIKLVLNTTTAPPVVTLGFSVTGRTDSSFSPCMQIRNGTCDQDSYVLASNDNPIQYETILTLHNTSAPLFIVLNDNRGDRIDYGNATLVVDVK